MTETPTIRRRKRVLTGCITCKTRRIKCDESKPSCRRCTDTGRRCDGYADPKPKRTTISPAVLMIVSQSGRAECDQKARHFFQYFYEVAGPALVNYGSHHFWNRMVLQACYNEESIKHLVIAASCLDYRARYPPLQNSEDNDPVFLSHYGKALQLLGSNHNPDTGVVLMACLLLVICEELQHRRMSAIQHIQAGRKILAACSQDQVKPGLPSTVDEIIPIFASLELHTGEFAVQIMPKHTRWPLKQNQEAFQAPLPVRVAKETIYDSFDSLEMAASCLQALVPSCTNPIVDQLAPATEFHTVGTITSQLNKWLMCFNTYTRRLDPSIAADMLPDIHVLGTYHLCMSIMSRCVPFQNESLFDAHGLQLEYVMVKASLLVDRPANFSLAAPLFFVATRYRDVSVRRRAVAMLRRCGWEGIRLATIANQIVRLEEKDLTEAIVSGDIPESKRVRLIDVTFHQGHRNCSLHYIRLPYDSSVQLERTSFAWEDVSDKPVQKSIRELLHRALKFEFMGL